MVGLGQWLACLGNSALKISPRSMLPTLCREMIDPECRDGKKCAGSLGCLVLYLSVFSKSSRVQRKFGWFLDKDITCKISWGVRSRKQELNDTAIFVDYSWSWAINSCHLKFAKPCSTSWMHSHTARWLTGGWKIELRFGPWGAGMWLKKRYGKRLKDDIGDLVILVMLLIFHDESCFSIPFWRTCWDVRKKQVGRIYSA